jgi:hypothetical protein
LFNKGGILLDALSIILVVIGSIIVYGVKYISKLLKLELSEIQVVVVKAIGLVIAIAGFIRILGIV